jgi:hypothetical protein
LLLSTLLSVLDRRTSDEISWKNTRTQYIRERVKLVARSPKLSGHQHIAGGSDTIVCAVQSSTLVGTHGTIINLCMIVRGRPC